MADNFYASYRANSGGGSSGVTSLNSLTGALTLVAGANITITPAGSNITIASTATSGANTALSNLAAVAINTGLVFGANGSLINGSMITANQTTGATGTMTVRSGNATAANSGNTTVSTGESSGNNASGNLLLGTGDAFTVAASGNIVLSPGAASTRGKILLVDGSESGGAGYVWTLQDTAGTGKWAASGGATGTANTWAYFNNSGVLASNATAKFDGTLNSFANGVEANGMLLNATGVGSRVSGNANQADISAGGIGADASGYTTGAGISASGVASIARGKTDFAGSVIASGIAAIALGHPTAASVTASGIASLARGEIAGSFGNIIASGIGSHAAGQAANNNITASGDASHAMAYLTTGSGSHTASGKASFAHGQTSNVSADFAASFGVGHTVPSFACLVSGQYSDVSGTTTSWVSTDPAFVIGNGANPGALANAFKVLKNGTTFIADPSLSGSSTGWVYTLQNTTTGEGAWAAAGGGGANTTLSNLGVTAINASLNSAGVNLDIGNTSFPWANIRALSLILGGNGSPSAAGTIIINNSSGIGKGEISLLTSPSGVPLDIAVFPIDPPAHAGLVTQSTASSSGSTGNLYVESGNATGSASNSGNVILRPGTATGTQGSIILQKSGVSNSVGDVWTATSTSGAGYWAAAPAGSWVKYTKTAADFTAGGMTTDIQLFSLPSKGVIHEVIMKHTTSFSGGGASSYTLSVGIAGNLTKYASAFDVFQGVSNTVFQSSLAFNMENFGAATSIRIAAVSDVTLSGVTAGSIDIYVRTTQLP